MSNAMAKPLIFFLVKAILITLTFGCQNQSEVLNENERSLENALASFVLEEDFQIELIAGEPLIADPVDMEIDEYGRLYVVEMHGYPLDVSGTGKVRLLSDTTGDGIMDKSIVFADSLVLPTGIMRWKKGILVSDPPNVYYLEDSDGDGKADIKEIVLTGFALSNPQHNVNSPRLGLDNWIYLGHEPAITTTIYEDKFGDRGNDVYYPENPDGARLPQNAGGRSVRFKPDSFGLELLASKTQFGHTSDAWGHRFLVNNSNHIIHDVISATYLNRNPYLLVSESTQSLSDHGDAAEVFPITENPEHQLLTDLGVMTSACGITAYLGAAFPRVYDKAIFVAEPVSNIVHIDFLTDKATGFVASRQHAEKEFLASADAWFRPVNMYIGPDGALYVVDYYRQIIEHPEWMAENVVSSGALYNGTDQGRIYRITPKGTKPIDWSDKIKMGDFTDVQLVEKLGDPNIWWRRNAQRLLLDRNPVNIPEALTDMAKDPDFPLARLHALWTLEGLGKLNPELIIEALNDPEPGLRENAIKLAELHLGNTPELADALLGMKGDKDPKVRFQLLCTLGFMDGFQAAKAREELLFLDIEDEWIQVAALSAPFSESNHLLEAVLSDFRNDIPAYGSLVRRLSAMTGASQQQIPILKLIKKGISNVNAKENGWQAPLLKGLAQGLQSKNGSSVSFKSAEHLLVEACFKNSPLSVRQASFQLLKVIGLSENVKSASAMKQAREIAGNNNLSGDERAFAIDFLSLLHPETYKDFLKDLINPVEPISVQLAALKTLNSISDDSSAQLVLEQWNSLTPEIREEAINILMVNEERISILLDAMESGLIQPANLGWRRSVRLMSQKDEFLRSRARLLINNEKENTEELLKQYQPALEGKGSMENGKIIFQQNCAICHKMGDETGMEFGPDLASLKNRRPQNILSDILKPNLSIADGYELWAVQMQNGETYQGIISSETPTAIRLSNAGGHDVTISRQDIKSLQVLEMSAMPSGLEKNINPREMADLLAYIRKIK